MRSHVTLLQGKVVSCTEYKPPYREHVTLQKKEKEKRNTLSLHIFPSPERGVDLQGFAQHLGPDVVHVITAQVHFSQAGVATQGVDQHGAPRAQARLGQGQRLQGLERQRGNRGGRGMCVKVSVCVGGMFRNKLQLRKNREN